MTRSHSCVAWSGRLGVGLAVVLSLGACPALAEGPRLGLFGERAMDPSRSMGPPIARYVSEDGDVFVLDRTNSHPLLKFQDNPEVFALQSQPAPRGDVIYKNDVGEPVLRATRLGGVTLFTNERPEGSAAMLAGDGPALRLPILGPQALLERLAQASARATRAARRLIPFEADASPGSSAVVADAALVAAEAVVRLAKRPNGQGLLARLGRIQLIEGTSPNAFVQQGVMQITVDPGQGLAGRPSSDRIMAAIGAR